MKDHVYLILGGTGGIGSATAQLLTEAGAKVAVAGRNVDRLQSIDGLQLPGDATEPDVIDGLVQSTLDHFGRLDGAVNCIGSLVLKPSHLTTDEEWADTIAKNLTTSFRLIRAFAKAVPQGGSLVMLSSAAARLGLSNHEAIAAAKAGVIGLTLSAAATYASRGLRINCVAPGLVQTELTKRITSSEPVLKASTAMHALGRVGTPDDVARAILWFLNPQQNWVTGQVLGVDGGLGSVRAK